MAEAKEDKNKKKVLNNNKDRKSKSSKKNVLGKSGKIVKEAGGSKGTDKTRKGGDRSKSVGLDARKERIMRRIDRRTRAKKPTKEQEEFDVRLVSIRRVAKVKAGGKRLRMSVLVVVGDKAGKVGIALAKGKGVKDAQNKAVNKAKKNMVKVALKGQTIPHEITQKYKAAKVFLKPAAPGTGVIAGGAVRAVVEVTGIKDILSKVIGSKNVVTNVYATFEALKNLRLTRFD